jgi:hypothetical protein
VGKVSLRKHLKALRKADQSALKLLRRDTKQKFLDHNNILTKWQDATLRDRANFVTIDAFNALKDAYTLAAGQTDGRSKGIDGIRVAILFVISVAGTAITSYLAFKGH